MANVRTTKCCEQNRFESDFMNWKESAENLKVWRFNVVVDVFIWRINELLSFDFDFCIRHAHTHIARKHSNMCHNSKSNQFDFTSRFIECDCRFLLFCCRCLHSILYYGWLVWCGNVFTFNPVNIWGILYGAYKSEWMT